MRAGGAGVDPRPDNGEEGAMAITLPTRHGILARLRAHAGLWLALVLAPIALIRALQLAERLGPPHDPVVLFDAAAYMAAASRAAAGLPLYLPLQIDGAYPASGLSLYLYPPLFAQLIAPLAGVDPLAIGTIFVVVSFAAAAVALLAIGRAAGAPRVLLAGVIAALLLIPGGFTTLVTANIEYAIVALLASAIALLPRRPMVAGALIAIAVLWKPLLFPLGLWLLARRERRPIVGALTLGGAAMMGSLVVGGIAPWSDYLRATANLTSMGLVGVTYSLGDLARTLVGPAALPLLALLFALMLGWLAPRRPRAALLLAVTGGIFAAPVIWGRYLLLLLPFVVVARDRLARAALFTALAIGTIEPRIDGSDSPALRLAVTIGVVGSLALAAARIDRERDRG